MLAVSGWEIVTAIGASATAAITLGILAVTVIAHLHDRSTSGKHRPVVATKTRSSFKPAGPQYMPDLPSDWQRQNTRWTALRMLNLAPYATVVIPLPERTRFGFRRRRGRVEPGMGMVTLPSREPQNFVVLLHRRLGWGNRNHARVVLYWETNDGRIVRLRGRVWLKPWPEANYWAESQPLHLRSRRRVRTL